MGFAKWYRVDNVPFYWKPFFWAYGYGLGTLYYLYFALVHCTSKIIVEGVDPRSSDSPVIYAVWHNRVMILFCYFTKLNNVVIINHPTWLMKAVHFSMWLTGIKRLILGSTGHDGRAAADELAEIMRKEKCSTFINPDGPSGPLYVLKRGVLHLSIKSSAPVVPLAFKVRGFVRFLGWDRKIMPLPFSTIHIRFGKPIQVSEDNFENSEKVITETLTWKNHELKE